jgi:hypothetical protein
MQFLIFGGIIQVSYTIVVSICSNLSDNGTYNADLELIISSQNGSATGSFDVDGSTLYEYIQLSGTIA